MQFECAERCHFQPDISLSQSYIIEPSKINTTSASFQKVTNNLLDLYFGRYSVIYLRQCKFPKKLLLLCLSFGFYTFNINRSKPICQKETYCYPIYILKLFNISIPLFSYSQIVIKCSYIFWGKYASQDYKSRILYSLQVPIIQWLDSYK